MTAMIPIRELLNRIRWDPGFAPGQVELGYFDRLTKEIVRVPLQRLSFPPARRGIFELADADGLRHRIPLHRVREVRVDGRVIWRRPT